ncbi:MAG: sugar ABC transporter permease [Treponema sp.]|jgi:multiple sugar transport system permease protein|nr:sugar ABC transporter permease [Treponema sp.]
MNTNKRNTLAALPYLLPSFIGFVLFSAAPMAVLLLVSLTDWNALGELTLFQDAGAFMAEYFSGFANYQAIFSSAELYQTLGNVLKFVALYIPLMLVSSFCIALILNRGRGTGIFRVIYYVPVITSWVAGALIWKWALSPDYGVINGILALFGVKGPTWLQSPVWAMPGVVLASVWKDSGYFGLMLFAGLRGIDNGYYEAADIDGAGKLRQTLRITLPLLSPVMFFVVIISMINSFQIFPQVMIMTPDGGPGGSTMVMVERIYRYAFRYYQMGYASALSWVLLVIILIFTFIQMKLQDRWVTYDT